MAAATGTSELREDRHDLVLEVDRLFVGESLNAHANLGRQGPRADGSHRGFAVLERYDQAGRVHGDNVRGSGRVRGRVCQVAELATGVDTCHKQLLLYEVLTGSTRFEKDTLRTAGFDEMRRIIREVEPPRPSARVSTLQAADLSTVCDRRNVEPHKLSQELRGELDWIVMKAMDKDRDRRYAVDVWHGLLVGRAAPSMIPGVGRFALRFLSRAPTGTANK